MRTILLVSITGALALVSPAFADDAAPSSSSVASAQQQCGNERAQMGTLIFKQTYGTNANRSNAFGKCVSKRARATEAHHDQAKSNAAIDCKAERDADAAAFKTKYGTGNHGANAFGKCVSQKAHAETVAAAKADVQSDVQAAKQCKTERAADPAAFRAKYGTNANHRNAFGKCVSQKAHEHNAS